MRDTLPFLLDSDFPKIRRRELTTLQANLGYLCNIACLHCHVAAGPTRTELMDLDTVELLLQFMRSQKVQNLDVTGGSPEMNPHFKYLMTEARSLGVHLMDRCNPTIIEEPGYEWVPEFLAENEVEVIASMPCYLEDNVDSQRGNGVFQASIKGLKKLNDLGYGQEGSNLQLNLVYNPIGPSLPPPQVALQEDYKSHLGEQFGLKFNNLFTITNMPIKRFGSTLLAKGQFDEYMTLLTQAYQQANLGNVMCRDLISVDYQGYVFDCDFNQMLEINMQNIEKPKAHIRDLIETKFNGMEIAVASHCYGCTAGQGSSCGGALN